MQLTREQRNAVDEPGNLCLVSCPGSGKTRVIIAKLLGCVEAVRDTTRRVACITHTNAAADEIEARLCQTFFGVEGLYYDVDTIHGFTLRHVLGPFHHLLPEFRDGLTIITSDDERFTAKVHELTALFALHPRVTEDFDRIQRGPSGSFAAIDSLPFELQQTWCEWLDANGLTTLGDIVFHGGRIVSAFPHVASALASHFAWILVDEFQDSSPGQVLLLKEIHRYRRTQFFCVGDPNQSIYRFAGASPDLFDDFAEHVGANTKHRLTGNFRSSAHICALAERLRQAQPPMCAVGEYAAFDRLPLHQNVATPLDGILDHFLPAAEELNVPLGEIAILAPWWVSLFNLARELRRLQIPVMGPGARPYRRNHLIAPLVEAVGAYLESPEADVAIAVQRALFLLLAQAEKSSPYFAFDFKGRLAVCRILAAAAEARRISGSAVDWISDAIGRFKKILIDADALNQDAAVILTDSATQMTADILARAGGHDLTVEDLAIFARPKHCVQLLTVHKAKGREFEAVAVIDAHDGRFPHFSIGRIQDAAERQAAFDESRRVVYVAATRAKRLLMFFTDRTDARHLPMPFLEEMGL